MLNGYMQWHYGTVQHSDGKLMLESIPFSDLFVSDSEFSIQHFVIEGSFSELYPALSLFSLVLFTQGHNSFFSYYK